MENLKFRIWDKQVKKFFYQLPKEHHLVWERFEVQQYIRFNDKYDKEIYEGDLVKCQITDKSEDYLQLEAGNKDYVIREISIPEIYQEGLPDDCEIIGNIFENPKLANKKL